MKKLSELFDMRYGHSLELNRLTLVRPERGVAFVSRKNWGNGISAYVEPVDDEVPASPGVLTVALGGQGGALSTFLQERPFYTGRDVEILASKGPLSKAVLLYYCVCIKANAYRYGFGRQANRTLKDIAVPGLDEIPEWVEGTSIEPFVGADRAAFEKPRPSLNLKNWKAFEYQKLFDIEVGKGPRLKDLDGNGATPVVTSTDSNNGQTGIASCPPNHKGNTISVNRDGSVGEAFYQPLAFCSSEAVHVFVPRFPLNQFVAMFLTTLIRQEKFRYTYGRKWSVERMKKSIIRLPVTKDGAPDWAFMVPSKKTAPVLSGKGEPPGPAGVVWMARCTWVTQLGTRLSARSYGSPGVMA